MAKAAWFWGAACAALAACGSDVQTTPGTGAGAGGGTAGGGGVQTTTSQSSTATGGAGGMGTGGSGTGGLGAGGLGAGGQGGSGGGQPQTVKACYEKAFVNPPGKGPDYDQFGVVVGSHCLGTNHQDITGVERVVFLGDSVTVGTPPTLSADYYRSQLAEALAAKFGLEQPSFLWKTIDVINGKSLLQEAGAFASCSKWGARTDDLVPTQIPECFPQKSLQKRTLVVMTMGGNDLSSLTQGAIDGKSEQELWDQTKDFVKLKREAVEWLTTPGRFPNGVFVVFANMYEFTDGTGEVEACDVSGLAGFDKPVPAPDKLADMVIWANEQYLKIAVDTKTDAIFLLEEFCGHGFNADNPAAPCYRGPGQETWFDLTCIHPNPKGHDKIGDMFMAVVNE